MENIGVNHLRQVPPFAMSSLDLRLTYLASLSFTLVVALMTVMLAFVNGLYHITGNAAVPGNIVILSDGALDESMSNLGNASSSNPIYLLNEEQKQYIEHDDYGSFICVNRKRQAIRRPVSIL